MLLSSAESTDMAAAEMVPWIVLFEFEMRHESSEWSGDRTIACRARSDESVPPRTTPIDAGRDSHCPDDLPRLGPATVGH